MPLEPESWSPSGADLGPEDEAEQSELLRTVQAAVAEELTPRQREVLVALALNGVPIDVLAERLDTTRGALYKTLHDARRSCESTWTSRGWSVEESLPARAQAGSRPAARPRRGGDRL